MSATKGFKTGKPGKLCFSRTREGAQKKMQVAAWGERASPKLFLSRCRVAAVWTRHSGRQWLL